jgi:hypothetical protein
MVMKLTVEQYQKINKLVKSYTQSEGIEGKLDELENKARIVSIALNKDLEDVRSMPIIDINTIARDVTGIPKGRIKKYLLINGKLYKGLTASEKLNAGQLFDLKNFAKEGFVENIHNMAAVLYSPVLGKQEHSQIAEIMKGANIADIYTLLFFYSVVLEKLNPTIQMSLELAAQEIAKVMEEIQKESLVL